VIDLLVVHGTVVTVDQQKKVISDGAIAVGNDRILGVGPAEEILGQFPEARRVITAGGKAVFPGLVNTHTHSFQSLLKGLGDDRVLSDWLAQMTFPAASHLTPELAGMAATLSFLDAIRSGTTTILDYFYPHPVPGLADACLAAMEQTGIRGIYGRGMIDNGEQYGTPRAIMQCVDDAIQDCERLLKIYPSDTSRKLQVWLAPAAVWLCTRDMLLRVKELQDQTGCGLTIHVSETLFDREATRVLHGGSDVEVMCQLGLMRPSTLLVHVVYLTQEDISLCRQTGVSVSHNPVSNMYLSSGIAPIPELRAAGVNVSLATDGAASNNSQDMLEVLKSTALLHKVHSLNPTVIRADEILEMATIGGARALGMAQEIGSLEVGKKADFFIFNPQNHPKSVPMHQPVSTLVYASSPVNVETVVIDGQIVLDEGKMCLLDEYEALGRATEAAREIVRRGQIQGSML
jgi:5-methylthioadenosine/S-adenosylhomocysteine deaminase